VNFAIDIGFARFEILGFTGCELAGLHAIGNAILLIFAAVIDGVARLRGCGLALLREDRSRGNQGNYGEHNECPVHDFPPGAFPFRIRPTFRRNPPGFEKF
jgi:hypothetical protein